jgi:hypothetical protein
MHLHENANRHIQEKRSLHCSDANPHGLVDAASGGR